MNGPVAVGGEDGVIEGAAAPSDMKSLRCCISCRLVKSFEQFYDEGCDNCPYLQMREDAELIDDCTTTEFNGISAIVDPSTSWVSKWLHHRKHVPGCYALRVNVDPSPELLEIMEENGVHFQRDN